MEELKKKIIEFEDTLHVGSIDKADDYLSRKLYGLAGIVRELIEELDKIRSEAGD